MIINRLTMHNFGVYAGTNTFEFTHNKPIVLIGGMNGRGKTTFLEAILLSLYGANSNAYKESKYNSYNQYLRAFVNKNDWSQSSFVELEFITNEESNNTYMIRREWNALSKITKETISVWKDGEYSDFLTKNWAMFIENLLPSALSSFFFFDGEKIAELAVDNTNSRMKESIRSMLGITVLDTLRKDLGRSIRRTEKRLKKDNSDNKLKQLREERDRAISNLNDIDARIAEKTAMVEKIHTDIEQLQKQYELNGGVVVEQRQKLIQERAQLLTQLNQNEDFLAGMAATELPLTLVKDLISDIKLQAEDEHNDYIMQQALEQMDYYLSAYMETKNRSNSDNRDFIEFVRKKTKEDETPPIYEMSEHAIFQMNELLESGFQDSVNRTKELFEQRKKIQRRLDDVDSYLTLDVNEKKLSELYGRIKELEEKSIQLQIELSKLQQERSSTNAEVISKTAEYNRDVEVYLKKAESLDDADRMLKYSNMAIQIVDKYTVELQKKKTGILGDTITVCYKKIANKKKLIQKITVDPESLDLKYVGGDGNEVPKASLSAGEKQLMVIAILWALAICSKKKLPVIIDTPLSRLDSQHRTSIIKTYFPNASDQTIILSTDTEIDETYYNMMKDSVGDEFTLIYNEETQSTSIRKGYF